MTFINAQPEIDNRKSDIWRFFPIFIFGIVFGLYAVTAAPGTLFGDPSEYQFIPSILGIAHPPGYAFYTLLAKLWQTLVPLGTIAFRTNRLAAAVGAWAVTAVYLILQDLFTSHETRTPTAAVGPRYATRITAAFAAFTLAAAPDFWQHAIHSNAHIVSVALAITHLWLLIRWWRTGQDRWLAAFAVTLGWAATHHPITLMGLPAYGVFVLIVRPGILRQWRTLLLLIGCVLLGLTPLLYYPLRSPNLPYGLQPTDMNTWEGFLTHTTAKGLRVNLFHFGLADQLDRAMVFWSLLRLQFSLPVILIIVAGLFWLSRQVRKPAILIGLFLLTHLLFTLNTVQDVMAYLLTPFAAMSVAAGAGALALSEFVARKTRNVQRPIIHYSLFIVHCLFFILPIYQGALNLNRGISLADFDAAEEYVDIVHQRFDGQGEGAVLLSDWEHLTPLWTHIYTQDEALAKQDVQKLVNINPAANPWVDSVWQHIEVGPIYIVDYRPTVRDTGFRLFPDGPFYRVIAPPVTDVTPDHSLDVWADDRIHILGYDLPSDSVRAGDPLKLILYQSVSEPLDSIWMPYARLGSIEARWTTDSRVLTNQWLPGEVIAEQYEIPVPFTLPPGEYPLHLGYADLIGGRPELSFSGGETTVDLGTIRVLPNADAPSERVLERALANLDNQIALMDARARVGWQTRDANWEEPLTVRAGRPLHLTLTWRALAAPRASHTVFIHLIDGAGRPVVWHDYTPLGGSCPTYLWFPKWLSGQTFTDPYRLPIPADLTPGDYWLEVGMYGMTSLRRLPVVDLKGNLAGDRVILGLVRVE
ncbi:MAG: DUF2723 domain-containing protein [Chloroflexi bacterium]|nr:DUF2723 domain-containing protein [Chloroflexota bacterium]